MNILKFNLLYIFLFLFSYNYAQNSGTFIDERDKHNYKWVKIGYQIWMAENLAYLPTINYSNKYAKNKVYYYVYNYSGNNLSQAIENGNLKKYGVLYNWEASIISCPIGWHLPRIEEWENLANFINEKKGPFEITGKNYHNLGMFLKSNSGWPVNNNGTDDFGFTALPSGVFFGYTGFDYIGKHTEFWSASTAHAEFNSGFAWATSVSTHNDFGIYDATRDYGLCVRCIKDATTNSNLIDNLNLDVFKCYPNPCTNFTYIQYSIENDSDTKISISDITGKQIDILVNEYKFIGKYIISFYTENLPKGIYILKLDSKQNHQRIKLIKT